MITTVRAIYESKGVLRLLQPLQLPEGSEVKISLELPTPISDPAYDLATLVSVQEMVNRAKIGRGT